MWISQLVWKVVTSENDRLRAEVAELRHKDSVAGTVTIEKITQKAKDDITIDWMRHRINALEKDRAALLVSKGIAVSVPEIVPARPGSVTVPPMDFASMPTFEDVGDQEAARLGVTHDEHGNLVLGMPGK